MIIKPTLLIDEKKCFKNIREIAEKARRHSLIFRPHFKTHQLHEIGNWFREEGFLKLQPLLWTWQPISQMLFLYRLGLLLHEKTIRALSPEFAN